MAVHGCWEGRLLPDVLRSASVGAAQYLLEVEYSGFQNEAACRVGRGALLSLATCPLFPSFPLQGYLARKKQRLTRTLQ